jgi:hypothetical protein
MYEAAQVLQIPANEPARRTTFWLIMQRRRGGTEVLTRELSDGRRVLPVFSFEEEAVLYARTGAASRARPTSAGELLSILYGPCRGVELVALDPWPNTEAEALTGLVSLGRNRFLKLLMNKDRSARSLRRVSPVPNGAYGTGRSKPPSGPPGDARTA